MRTSVLETIFSLVSFPNWLQPVSQISQKREEYLPLDVFFHFFLDHMLIVNLLKS